MTTKSTDRDQTETPSEGAKVVDLSQFRKKKTSDEEFGRGRQPLYVSHLTGKVTGQPQQGKKETEGFGDRLSRIRTSLDKINRLMSELKRMSSGAEPEAASKSTDQSSSKKQK